MKIELRNVHFSERLSEETNAFTADIYVDGKKAGTCGNHGTGGPTDYHFADRAVQEQFEAYAKSLPPEESEIDITPRNRDGSLPANHKTKKFTIESNGEHVIDKLFEEWLDAREAKKAQVKESKFVQEYLAKGATHIVKVVFQHGSWLTAKRYAVVDEHYRTEYDTPKNVRELGAYKGIQILHQGVAAPAPEEQARLEEERRANWRAECVARYVAAGYVHIVELQYGTHRFIGGFKQVVTEAYIRKISPAKKQGAKLTAITVLKTATPVTVG